MKKIAEEAAKKDSIFSVNDRVGLVYDVLALAKAGQAPLSDALTVVETLKNEEECEAYSHYFNKDGSPTFSQTLFGMVLAKAWGALSPSGGSIPRSSIN